MFTEHLQILKLLAKKDEPRLHNRGNFYKYNICDCQIISFQKFSYHP